MYEGLLVHAIFFKTTKLADDRYFNYLNKLFLENPADDLLLELQWCTNDVHKTTDLIINNVSKSDIDFIKFNKALITELEVYFNNLTLENFCEFGYLLWKNIPFDGAYEDPLHILSYADDSMSWGDKQQTIDLYEKVFRYYDED